MAYSAHSYNVICTVEETRKVILGGIDVYYGYQLMHDDGASPSGEAILCVTGDASDVFCGIALETVLNASDAQGAAGDVFINVMRKGTYIAELDSTPDINSLGQPVFPTAAGQTVSLTIGSPAGYAMGRIVEWQNVSDPLGRTNAVKVRIGDVLQDAT